MSPLTRGPSMLGMASKAKAGMSRHARRAIGFRSHVTAEAKP